MAQGTYALTTTAKLKTVLGITVTTFDTLLDAYVDRASALIEQITGRRFVSRAWTEWYDLNENADLILRQWPVVSVKNVLTGSADVLTVGMAAASSSIEASIQVTEESVVVTAAATDGTEDTDTFTFSSAKTTSALATSIAALGTFTATAVENVRTVTLHPLPGAGLLEGSVTLTAARDREDEYSVNMRTGVIHLLCPQVRCPPRNRQRILVEYTAGYSAVPFDVEEVAIEVAGAMYKGRGTNPEMQSENLGEYAYARMGNGPQTLHDLITTKLAGHMELR